MTAKNDIKATLKLIQRSPDRGNGWRSVSTTCWPLIEALPNQLVERDYQCHRVRMTDEGIAVLTFS